MSLILGTNVQGRVLLVLEADDIKYMPEDFNGAQVLRHMLTTAQEEAYRALPAIRAGVDFDGEAFTAIPLPPPSPEEERLALDAAEAAAVKADNQVIAFLNFTPAQLDSWIDTNIGGAATLAAVRAACVTAFKVLGRIALAAGRGRTLR